MRLKNRYLGSAISIGTGFFLMFFLPILGRIIILTILGTDLSCLDDCGTPIAYGFIVGIPLVFGSIAYMMRKRQKFKKSVKLLVVEILFIVLTILSFFPFFFSLIRPSIDHVIYETSMADSILYAYIPGLELAALLLAYILVLTGKPIGDDALNDKKESSIPDKNVQ